MHVWLLFLAGTTVYGISRILETDLIAVNFAKAVEGRKLNGSVISEEDVDSESSCGFNCLNEERCLSYNFGRTKNKAGRFKCELSDFDRFVGIANFTEDEDFKYVGIQTACDADRSPCADNEVCIPDYKNESVEYKCVDVSANCSSGWNKHGKSCYYIDDTPTKNWSNAREACLNRGADLPIITSEEQNQFITDLLASQSTVEWDGAWIGLRRNDDDTELYWIDGTPLEGMYTAWRPNNPSKYFNGTLEGCVHIRNDGKWNDAYCAGFGGSPVILCTRPVFYF